MFDPSQMVPVSTVNPKSTTEKKPPYKIKAKSDGKKVYYYVGPGIWEDHSLNTQGYSFHKDRVSGDIGIFLGPEAESQVLKRKEGATKKGTKFKADVLTDFLVSQDLVSIEKEGLYYLDIIPCTGEDGEAYPNWFTIVNDDTMENEIIEPDTQDIDIHAGQVPDEVDAI